MTKPRITISLREQDYQVIARLSAANGESMSSIVAGLVAVSAPALERVAQVVEAAASAQSEVLEGMRASMERAEAQLTPLALSGQAEFLSALDGVLEGLQRPEDPRSVITGVRSGRYVDISQDEGLEK